MFGISGEHIIILGIVLIIFGPRRLPELGHTLGKAIRNFKDSISGVEEAQYRRLEEEAKAKAKSDAEKLTAQAEPESSDKKTELTQTALRGIRKMDDRLFTKYLNLHEIDAAVQSLGHRLSEDYKNSEHPVVLVCVLKGAIIFMADLVRHLKIPVEIEFVRLSSYGKGRTSSGTVTILKDIGVDIRGKHVLIVEEIIDSGRTLKFLFDRLKSSQPASVEIVTLLDKKAKRVVDVPVKYVGKLIEDQFLVGYGLDLEEKCRNLPDIYCLKYPN